MSDDDPNPLTRLFPLAVGVFGWQVHGLVIGFALAVAYIVVAIASNAQIIARGSDDWARRIQSRKWFILLLFMIGIAISGAKVVDI